MPPTAGTARFENDIESWSSLVRHSGSRIGTQPMSDTAVAMFVPNEMISATPSHQKLALEIVSQNSAGSPTWLSNAKTAMSVPTAMRRLVVFTRASCCSAGGFDAGRRARGVADFSEGALEIRSLVAAAGAHVVAQCRGLEERQRVGDLVVAEHRERRIHRALGPDELRGAHQQLGDVGVGDRRSTQRWHR